MKNVEAEVKSKQRVVGHVVIPVYETLEEAVENEGAETVLNYFNVQNKTNRMNAARQAAQPNVSKQALRKQAMAEITEEEFREFIGDPDGLQGLIDRKAEEIQKRLEAEAMTASGVEEEDED